MARQATMKVWDVELGLAIHIAAPNGKYIVIDLGSKANVSPLRSLLLKTVGYMVITHPHHDHFSDIQNIKWGYPKVLWRVKDYSREELVESARAGEKDDFIAYCDFCESFDGEVEPQNNPKTTTPFDGLTAEVFQTNACNKNNKNNFSAIVVLTLGKAKIVVCGDNEEDSFKILMNRDSFKKAVSNAYVLVAPHHGRDSGYYEEFVDLVKPYLTIISDTSEGETSVTEKYDNKTKGWDVYNCSTGKRENRKCLTTRNDGNIKVVFGETDDPNYSGHLSASMHCSF
ncbi:MAG: MBL fold metallo-hydrolase [Bacteroidaceae bacterium]|nr:MBL fold metallo-hydrolase [Bacteroidaceae bacterium]